VDARERVLTALRGGEPDRVPMALGFFPQSLFGAPDADEHFQTDVRFVDFAPPAGQDSFLEYLDSLPAGVHVGSLAQLRTYHEWDYHPEREERGDSERAGREQPGAGSATDAEQGSAGQGAAERGAAGLQGIAARLARLQARVTEPRRHAHLKAQVDGFHARGLAVAGSPPHLGGELFESAWRLRGFETFMKDLVKRPALVEYLLDQLTVMTAESAAILAAAGVDVLVLDDDVAYKDGLLLSPAMWRRYFKPRLAAIIDAARRAAGGRAAPRQTRPPETGHGAAGEPAAARTAAGRPDADLAILYHSDGDFTALLPDLVEVGVDAVNPVAPDCMDAAVIRASFGARPALWGTVGTAWTWDQGSPTAIREEVRSRVHSLGRSGLLLCPAYDLDFTPRENVVAFVEAVRESG
jgi:Uroporphyrinogen decarboxylase (URO-D)